MMQKIIVANWKMNPQSAREAEALARVSDHKGVVIAPPFPFLGAVKNVITQATLGAQDIFYESRGAYTGEVSGAMLRDCGAQYVIVGHSERRAFGETDEIVARKIVAILRAGLTAILCVGEPHAVRDRGIDVAKAFVTQQLKHDLAPIGGEGALGANVIITYEPVWAISGSGGTNDTPENATAMITHIKSVLAPENVRVLYGGSVNASNTQSFLSEGVIDGVLVGGASVDASAFKTIIECAENI
jgi:triosephosphate isomerase